MVDAVQHLNPYRETALDYRKAGWHGTLPIPHKQKNPPPTGYTGHRAAYPELEKINEWRSSKKRQNICVRCAGVDKEHEIIGIDVDHYQSGNKDKRGGDQLKALEQRFGPLPTTWISSSRTDGYSGIRYFRVPRGLAFRGQVAKDIECISKGYRFAVVWPSIHPSGETYWWFPPRVLPDSAGRGVWDGASLPDATSLPSLPDAWLEYLTQNKMRADSDDRIDMDTDPEGIWQWCDATLHGDDDTEMCSLMASKVVKHIEKIQQEATSHDKIVNAHYNIAKLAFEGHHGFAKAISEVQSVWAEEVLKRDKRSIEELQNEAKRSRLNAFRKIKAQSDDQLKMGSTAVSTSCLLPGGICYSIIGDDQNNKDQPPPDDPLEDIPRGSTVAGGEYRLNDDGNAQHFVDMYSNLKMGPAIRYADGYGWIVWHKGKGDGQPHWQLDRDGDQEMRRMFQKVRDEQEAKVERLRQDFVTKQNQFLNQQPGVSKVDVDAAKSKWQEWKKFAILSGNNRNANNAIEAIKSVSKEVKISVNDLDKNSMLLGVSNGVLGLDREDVYLTKATSNDYITLNTHIPYEKPSVHAAALWNQYLETFIPDKSLRRDVQIAFGYTLLGGNQERKMIVLIGKPKTGKSTLINVIEAALGDYAMTVGVGFFQNSKFNEERAAAFKKRVVVCSEFTEEDRLNAAVIKRMTGGSDKISEPIKFSMEVHSGRPQYVPIIATNSPLKIIGADKALEDRLWTIPFEIRPAHIDTGMTDIVTSTCKIACLNWLIEGYKEFRRIGGFPDNQLVNKTISNFMSDIDEVAAFISENITKHSNMEKQSVRWQDNSEWCVQSLKMYERFENWCVNNRIADKERLSLTKFTLRMKALGYRCEQMRVEGRTAKFWLGVRLTRRSKVVVGKFGPDVSGSESDVST